MPHSPRWYAGRLWVCESGAGGRSGLYNDDEKLLENSFVVPDAALADVSAALRRPAVNGRAPKAELAIA
jgi:hypothetical protein